MRMTEPIAAPSEATEAISMGLVFNFPAQTVAGSTFAAEIRAVNEVNFLFGGFRFHKIGDWRINGGIDRVTGDALAIMTTMVDAKTPDVLTRDIYSLKCKPTQRAF
jgi:hypothetical protein